MVSPRPSWSSMEDSGTGCPPSAATATSKDTRVRVDGFSKIRATNFPASRLEWSPGDCLTFAESSRRCWTSSLPRSSRDRKSRATAPVYSGTDGQVEQGTFRLLDEVERVVRENWRLGD